MKNATKFLMILSLLCITTLFACKKDDNSGQLRVVYKASGSTGTSLSVAVVGTDGKGGVETFTSLSGESWTSREYIFETRNGTANVAVNGVGVNASSTLKVEIWVNGEKKSEGNSTGTVLSASSSFSF